MKIISAFIIPLLISSCGITDMRKPGDTVIFKKGCEIEYSPRIKIERMSFKLPEFWSRFSNCNALMILDDTARGEWSINAMGVFGYKNVIGTSSALGFDVDTGLDAIGRGWRNDPDNWMDWKNEQWEKQAKSKNSRPKKRKVERVVRSGMDCWRVETESFLEKAGTVDDYEQSNHGVYYQCWGNDRAIYPPIELGAGITYREGKSLYPELDIDKDILDPVFNTLKIKKLTDQQYAAHVNKNIAKYEKFCEGMLDSYEEGKRKGGAYLEHINSEGFVKNMKECGHELQ